MFRFLWTSVTTFISTNQYKALCVFLFKDTLFNIHCWFINVELTYNSTITDIWSKLILYMHFLIKAPDSLLLLRDTSQNLSTKLQGRIKQQNHQKKPHKNVKNMALNKSWKVHLFIVWELKQEGRGLPCWTSAGNVHIMELLVTSEHINDWL